MLSRVPRPSLAAVVLPLLVAGCAPSTAAPEAPGAGAPPELAEFYGRQAACGPCAPYATSAIDEQLFANDRFDCARV